MASPSIIQRVGGKVRLAPKLLPLFPTHTCYVEAFVGGGSLFFLKDPSKVEILNDIDSELINLYKVVRFHPEEFNEQVEWAMRSREVFENMDTHLPAVTDIQRAVRYYLRIMMSFAAKGDDFGYWRSSRKAPIGRDWLQLSERLRTPGVIVENLDFRDILTRYDSNETFFYLDPPYEGTTTPYPENWSVQHTEDLVKILDCIKGKFLLSWGGPVRLKFESKVYQKKLKSAQSLGPGQKGIKRPAVIELAIANYRIDT